MESMESMELRPFSLRGCFVVLKAGDRVAYSVGFLKSIGMQHSSMAGGRGVIESIKLELASIDWQGADLPPRVHTCNLAKVGPNRRFANCD